MAERRVPLPPTALGTITDTAIQADASAPLNAVGSLAVCWMLVGQRYPQRAIFTRALLCVCWAILLALAFLLHNAGHIASARLSRAPMDALLLNAVCWINIYHKDNVSPRCHLGRAVGGPAASVIGIWLGRMARTLVPSGPFRGDLVEVFIAFNLVIGGASLLPLSSFDGGSLVKWAIYARIGSMTRHPHSSAVGTQRLTRIDWPGWRSADGWSPYRRHDAGCVWSGECPGIAALRLTLPLEDHAHFHPTY